MQSQSRNWTRFSLRLVLLLMTICCIAASLWQRPFEVESTKKIPVVTEDSKTAFVDGRQVMTMRRQLGDDHINHGPTWQYDDKGRLVLEEHWHRGVRDGLYRRWDRAGELVTELEFERGRLLRVGDTLVDHFMDTLATNGEAGEKIRAALLLDTSLEYVDLSLSDIVADISFRYDMPIAIDVHALRAAGFSEESPITAVAQRMPLFADPRTRN